LAAIVPQWIAGSGEGAIFGILGVETLGFDVDAAISELKLHVAVLLIFVMDLLSLSVDVLSRWLRRALRIDTMLTRLSAWLSQTHLPYRIRDAPRKRVRRLFDFRETNDLARTEPAAIAERKHGMDLEVGYGARACARPCPRSCGDAGECLCYL
jgi:hypothetical protein